MRRDPRPSKVPKLTLAEAEPDPHHSASISRAHSHPCRDACLQSAVPSLRLPVNKVPTQQPPHGDPGQREPQKRKPTVVTHFVLQLQFWAVPVPPSKGHRSPVHLCTAQHQRPPYPPATLAALASSSHLQPGGAKSNLLLTPPRDTLGPVFIAATKLGRWPTSQDWGCLLLAHMAPTAWHQVSQDLWERSSLETRQYEASGFQSSELGQSSLHWGFRSFQQRGERWEVKDETPTLPECEQHHEDCLGYALRARAAA